MADQPFDLFYLPFRPALDANGIVVPGASLTFYVSGTSTPQTIYADAGLTTPLANPVTANAAGAWPAIYIDNTLTYRVVLRNSLGAVLNEVDPYVPGAVGGPPGASDSAFLTLDELKAIDPALYPSPRLAAKLGSDSGVPNGLFNYQTAGAPYTADGVNIIKLNAVPLSTGALVRQGAASVVSLSNFLDPRPRSQQDKNDDEISVKDFGAIGDGVADDTAAIARALAEAKRRVLADTSSEGYGYVKKGGATVYLPAGEYKTSATLQFWLNVSIRGAGQNSSIIRGTNNGQILRNDPTTDTAGSYNREGSNLFDFGILGDTSLPNQDGLSLLRWTNSHMDSVAVNRCGRDAVVMRECSCGTVTNLRLAENIGRGLTLVEGLESGWDSPANNLPSNGMTFNGFRAVSNGSYGLDILQSANGITFNQCFLEYNNGGGTQNDGYQAHITSPSYVPIIFNGLWTEGDHLAAHVFVDRDGAMVKINDWRHFPLGALCNRALIARTGTVVVNDPWAPANAYPTINGSNAPFRVRRGFASIDLYGPKGATVDGMGWVEDEAGVKTGLFNELFQIAREALRGRFRFYIDAGATSHISATREDETTPYWELQPFNRTMALDDVLMKRTDVRTLGLDSRNGAQFIDAGNTWNGNHFRMGAYHLWVDSTGKLRIKSGLPTGDTDGTIVGTQA